MHFAPRKKELYGVVFDEPWKDIFTYVHAIREKKAFGVKTAAERGLGVPLPLERPYEMLSQEERPIEWDVNELFR